MHGPPTLVLLPGMDGMGEIRAPLVSALAPRLRVVALSYPQDRPLGYAELTQIVLDRLPPGRLVMLGESFGGPIAIRIANEQPDTVAGLILAATFVRNPLPRWLAIPGRTIDPRWLPHGILHAVMLGRFATPGLKHALSTCLTTVPPATLQARMAAVLTVDDRAVLRRVRCPILCLHGQRDRLIFRRNVADVLAIRPGATVTWLDAPHMVLETHPVEAATAISRFCDRLALGGALR